MGGKSSKQPANQPTRQPVQQQAVAKQAAVKQSAQQQAAEKQNAIVANTVKQISTNGRCGPQFGNTSCPGSQCCSQWGWCGGSVGTYSDWCSKTNSGAYGPLYDGTAAKPLKQPWDNCDDNNQCVSGYQCLASDISFTKIKTKRCLTIEQCERAVDIDKTVGNCQSPITKNILDKDVANINEITAKIGVDNDTITKTFQKYNSNIVDFNDAAADYDRTQLLYESNNFVSLKSYLDTIYTLIQNFMTKCDKKSPDGIYNQLKTYNILVKDTYQYIYIYTYTYLFIERGSAVP